MQRSVMHQPAARATRRLYAEFGFLLETSEITEIGGWTYVRRVPLGGRDRSAPAWLMPLLIRAVPRLRRRIRDCVAAARSDKAGDFVRRWYEEWQPDLAASIPPLRDVDLADLGDRESWTTTLARSSSYTSVVWRSTFCSTPRSA